MKLPLTDARAILLVAAAWGCGSEASVTSSSGNPNPGLATYRVSGTVTDESGAPIDRASVLVDQGQVADRHPETRRVITSTARDGRYEILLDANRLQQDNEKSALLRVWTENQEMRGHTQLFDRHATGAVKNIRLRRVRMIDAGQSIGITVEPDSSLCDSSGHGVPTLCEWVCVRFPRDGTLTVAAQADPPAGVVPTVRSWVQSGAGTISFEVRTRDSDRAEIAIAIPTGLTPRRVEVTTTLDTANAQRNRRRP